MYRKYTIQLINWNVILLPANDLYGRVLIFDSRTHENICKTSVFNFTLSWNSGQRMRFEVSPTTGSLNFVSTLADYRRYFFLRPFTLAFRGLFSGRYGKDANDERLSPKFVGYESLMRGYNFASFDPSECTQLPEGDNNCAEINRLTGSSMVVSNIELRFPLLGPDEFALIGSRTIPTTLTTFFDGGVSWTPNDLPTLRWATRTAERVPVFSAGASIRVNILGYLITELYYAIPFQRPDKGGYVGFHISPGW